MVTCAVFLRLNSLLKLAVLLLAMAVYSYLIHLAFLTLTRHDMLHRSVPAQATMLIIDIKLSVWPCSHCIDLMDLMDNIYFQEGPNS